MTVHTAVAAEFSQGIWRLSSVVPAVDAPTLTREMQVDIPKNVRLVGVPSGYTEIFQQKTDWIERISGLSQRESWFAKTNPKAASSAFDSRWFVPTSGRYQPRLFLLVNRWLLAVTVLVCCCCCNVVVIICFLEKCLVASCRCCGCLGSCVVGASAV